MKKRKRNSLYLVGCVTLFIFFLFSQLHAADSCGKIDRIYKVTGTGEKSINIAQFLKVFRNGIPIEATKGMEIYENDKIQAEKSSIAFDIIWNIDGKKSSISQFMASEDTPVQIILEECGDEYVFSFVGDTISIIKSELLLKPFKIKTKTAVAGIRGTTFIIRQFEYGNILKLLVLNGKVVLNNRFKEILVSQNEEGVSKSNNFIDKSQKSIDYIKKEARTIIDQPNLSPIFINEFNKYTIRQDQKPSSNAFASKSFQQSDFKTKIAPPVRLNIKDQKIWLNEFESKFEKSFNDNKSNLKKEYEDRVEVFSQELNSYMQQQIVHDQTSLYNFQKKKN